jgi:hypothetical protein
VSRVLVKVMLKCFKVRIKCVIFNTSYSLTMIIIT